MLFPVSRLAFKTLPVSRSVLFLPVAAVLIAVGLAPSPSVFAQDAPPTPQTPGPQTPPTPGQGRGAGAGGQGRFPGARPGGGLPASSGPRPYKEVITAEAKSDPGVFTVHTVGDKTYFEIPAAMLGKELLWTTEIEQLPAGLGYGGQAVGNRVVRWTRRGNKVYLKNVDYSVRAEGDEKSAIRRAVEAASLESVILAFDVEAEGTLGTEGTTNAPGTTAKEAAKTDPAVKDAKTARPDPTSTDNKPKSVVIDVTRLFTSDVPEFAAKTALGGTAVDPSRSYIDRVKAFPTNIETKSFLTFVGNAGSPFAGGSPFPAPTPGPAPAPPNPRRGGGAGGFRRPPSSISALIHYSMVLLPDKPMQPRLADSRVGFFTTGYTDYGRSENRAVPREFIARYRLEKKDPNAAISEPVKPIVYYVSREVPEKWRPAMKRAVESWNAAFEQAGFKNAIVCKDPPTATEDPYWDPEDARYSVIRWAPTPTENAQGPHTSDPRSGEILSAHIIVWHNVLKLAETWYFTQVGDLDPRAAKLPLPDSLMSDLIQYVVAHEVGHTLGLYHNFKASSSYSIAQLRDPAFTAQNGDEASIMDYGRFNYVAQPGDNARLIPTIGPYDKFAIAWGYTPIADAKTPDAEKPMLDKMASAQVENPMLRFGHAREMGIDSDPSQQSEDLGNDPVTATTMGLKNIARIAPMLIPAATKPGEDYDMLDEMYTALLAQRQRELGHVAAVLGGVVETDYHVGRGDAVYQPVPRDRQKAALAFLLDNGFQPPKELLTPALLYRIEPSGTADRVLASQRTLLATLLTEARVKRMLDAETLLPSSQAYTPSEMMTDLQTGLWRELYAPVPVVSLYRRNLQRAYLDQLKPVLALDTTVESDLRPIARGCLLDLEGTIDRAMPKVKDRDTMLHLRDCRIAIERILNPKA